MRTLIVVVVGAFAFIGCGKDEKQTETAESSAEQDSTTGGEAESAGAAADANCPMAVSGTSVQAEDVEGGAALVFITTGDVDALRERVRNMAARRESEAMRPESQQTGMRETMRPGSAEDPTAGAKSGDDLESGAGGELQRMPEVDTRVEDIEGGAQLLIIATNAADLDTVRANTQQQAQQLTAGECPMAAPHAMH
jgi:hypothetical protein